MANKEFSEFVQRQKAYSDYKKIDWTAQRDEWLGYLSSLYSNIEFFLKDYIKSGDIEVSRDKIILTEENIGSYQADRMHLKIGPRKISLVPIGTLLIGTKGRVDMVGPKGQAKFILVDKGSDRPKIKITIHTQGMNKPEPEPEDSKKVEWTWKIVANAPKLGGISFVELNQDSFMKAVLEVANG